MSGIFRTVLNSADLTASQNAQNVALAASGGAALVGRLRSGAGAVQQTLAAWAESRSVNLFEFFTPAQVAEVRARTLLTNMAAAVQAAIDSMEARGGGRVDVPHGSYRLTSEVRMKRGVWLAGEGCRKPGGAYDGASVFYGAHAGAAVLSLKGAHCCGVTGLTIVGDQATPPKTGLLMGRSSADSAGLHAIDQVHVDGYFTHAAIYSIASESNRIGSIFYTLRGGGALYGYYTSQGDELAVDGLTGSSNLENTIAFMEGVNMVNNPAAVGLFINGGAATGTWNVNAYLIQHKGAYCVVQAGASDGLDALGPFRLDISGEIYDEAGGGTPTWGYDLRGTTAICGLNINGGRFQFINSTGNERSIRQGAAVTLKQPHIALQVMSNATAELLPHKIVDGYASAGVQAFTGPALLNGWTDAFAIANGMELPGYYRDPDGWVHLKGVCGAGVVGSPILQLPAGYRPAVLRVFPVLNNGVMGRLEVSSAGNVTLAAGGTNNYVSLDGIYFKAA